MLGHMKHSAKLFLALLVLTACSGAPAGGTPGAQTSSTSAPSSVRVVDMVVDSPAVDAVVTSPLTVTGKATGAWFFEASFPVRLIDDRAVEIATGHAEAQGDWMTEDLVPFTASLTFTTTAKTGTLVLQKDNPSGMPENDKSMAIPVKF